MLLERKYHISVIPRRRDNALRCDFIAVDQAGIYRRKDVIGDENAQDAEKQCRRDCLALNLHVGTGEN